MNQGFLQQVDTRLIGLSRAESQVGQWLLGNAARAVDFSVQQVASESEVSEPTVVRFCRSMGLRGFRQLKTELIASLQKTESYLHHDVEPEDDAASAAVKVLESSLNQLVDLRHQISAMPFEASALAIANARQVVFVGLGASGHVATDACHKFFRLGMPCTTATDSPTILQLTAVAEPSDVLVAVSHTGQWPELLRGVVRASERGATIIGVTDPHSALAEAADLLLPCGSDEDANVFTPMSSRLVHLTVLDALQVCVALKLGKNAEDNLRAAKSALRPEDR